VASSRKIQTVTGRAESVTVRQGTASEHTGIVLQTPEGERLVLVRRGSNPFEDGQTAQLEGKTLEVEGYRVGNELRYVSIRTL
jgi:hypothetical protein